MVAIFHKPKYRKTKKIEPEPNRYPDLTPQDGPDHFLLKMVELNYD